MKDQLERVHRPRGINAALAATDISTVPCRPRFQKDKDITLFVLGGQYQYDDGGTEFLDALRFR